MFLTPEELIALTGKTRSSWQAKELEHLGIPYKPRKDRTLIVLRIHVEGMHHQQPTREPRLRTA